jgi:hypothetical protein
MKTFESQRPSRWLIALIIVLFIFLLFLGIDTILANDEETSCQVYKAIGFGMITIWVCIFICYFIWAVYFYNLNYGYSKKAWEKIDQAKSNRTNGLPFRQEDIDEQPKYNPYKDQTFGLPGGTVRGMIAFTLLFGSIAMLIVSFGMKNEVQANTFFIDQFDFFKKAFLMMIAFYFGTHSLKYLQANQTQNPGNEAVNESNTNEEPQQPEIVVVEPNSNQTQGDEVKMPPITAIDPMAPKG